MTILSDITIEELSNKPVRTQREILAELKQDESLLASIKEESKHSNHPVALEHVKLLSKADEIWEAQDFGMIYPFEPGQIRTVQRNAGPPQKIISMGTTSYGYDVSLAKEFKIFSNINSGIIDPKRLDESACLVDAETRCDENGDLYVILPPNSYLLGRTVEYFRMPRNVLAICMGKSTYARAGVIVNVTPIEPGFQGNVVIEISNATNLPVKIYAHEGISQFVFMFGDRPCRTSYGDRDGKYQGQTGITLPKV